LAHVAFREPTLARDAVLSGSQIRGPRLVRRRYSRPRTGNARQPKCALPFPLVTWSGAGTAPTGTRAWGVRLPVKAVSQAIASASSRTWSGRDAVE